LFTFRKQGYKLAYIGYQLNLEKIKSMDWHSGVAKRGQMGERALGRRPWGRIRTLFAVI